MTLLKIKQLEERVATQGVHLGGGPERRKLEPGEVVDIPEDLHLSDGSNLLDLVWDTGKVELTRDPPTRPLDYQDYREARLCRPDFHPRDMNEEHEMQRVRAEVLARLNHTESEAPETVSPANDVLDSKPKRKPRNVKRNVTQNVNPRAKRRATLRAAKLGTEDTT